MKFFKNDMPAVPIPDFRKLGKYVLNSVICLLMILLLFYFLCTVVLRTTILNPGFGVWCLDRSTYTERLAGDMQKSMVNLGQSSGIPEEVLKKTVSTIQLRKQLVGYVTTVSNYLAGEEEEFSYEVDTSEFEDQLNEKIDNYALQQQIGIDSTTRHGVRTFVKECADIYTNGIVINARLLPQFRTAVRSFNNLLPLMGLLFAALVLIQVGVNRSFAHTIHWLSICLMILGMAALTISLLFFSTGIIDRLNLEPEFFKELVGTVVGGIAFDFALAGTASLTVGLLLKVAYNRTRKKRLREVREMHEMWGG